MLRSASSRRLSASRASSAFPLRSEDPWSGMHPRGEASVAAIVGESVRIDTGEIEDRNSRGRRSPASPAPLLSHSRSQPVPHRSQSPGDRRSHQSPQVWNFSLDVVTIRAGDVGLVPVAFRRLGARVPAAEAAVRPRPSRAGIRAVSSAAPVFDPLPGPAAVRRTPGAAGFNHVEGSAST